MIKMDIKYPIENEYMKCGLQINGFSGPRPQFSFQHSGQGESMGGSTRGVRPTYPAFDQ